MQEPAALFDPFALRTRARRAGSDWVLDGLKSMVPLATRAELFLIAAQMEDQDPALVLVESSSKGLHIEADPSMGLRAAGAARLRLDGVTVPMSQVLAEGAAAVYRECIQLSRLAWCALGTGCAQAVLDYVISYANKAQVRADAARSEAIARGSAMACTATLDALRVLEIMDVATHR